MVEFRWPAKFCLFLTSYVPLFLILAVELHERKPIAISNIPVPIAGIKFPISIISILLITFSFTLVAFLVFLIKYHSNHKRIDKKCDHFQQRNELLSSYLLVYVFVFVGLDFSELSDWTIFLLFFAMLAVLQMRSEMLHINPLLGLAGFRVYEVESQTQTLLVISKDNIRESIKVPESQIGEREPTHRNIELIQLGPSTYMTPLNND